MAIGAIDQGRPDRPVGREYSADVGNVQIPISEREIRRGILPAVVDGVGPGKRHAQPVVSGQVDIGRGEREASFGKIDAVGAHKTEERSAGKGGVSTCRSWWAPYTRKKKKKK